MPRTEFAQYEGFAEAASWARSAPALLRQSRPQANDDAQLDIEFIGNGDAIIRDLETVIGDANYKLLARAAEIKPIRYMAFCCTHAYLQKGGDHNFVEAERRFRLVLSREPRDPDAQLGLGLLYHSSDDESLRDDAWYYITEAAKAGEKFALSLLTKNNKPLVQARVSVNQNKNYDTNSSNLEYSDLLPADKTEYKLKFSTLIRSLNESDKLGLSDDEINKQAEHYTESLLSSTIAQNQPNDPGPMPTREELEKGGDEKGRLYRQARTRSNLTIIDHLKAVWMPWIKAGVLTMPELGKPNRDPSAYKALAVWRTRKGNDLKTALGYDIPTKTDIVNSHIAAAAILPPGERPAKLLWVQRKRAAKIAESYER
jgi:hypothetical protein